MNKVEIKISPNQDENKQKADQRASKSMNSSKKHQINKVFFKKLNYKSKQLKSYKINFNKNNNKNRKKKNNLMKTKTTSFYKRYHFKTLKWFN